MKRKERHINGIFFFNDTATTEIYTLSLHDALPISIRNNEKYNEGENGAMSTMTAILGRMATYSGKVIRSEEHTSELQSH